MNRREFLHTVRALTANGLVMSAMPWFDVFAAPPAAASAASDRVRLGFIGVGSRGRTLLLNVQSFQERLNVEIAAVCDTYPEHLERAVALTGGAAQGFDDYRRMLQEGPALDGVVIATPLHEHAGMTCDALEAGLHVFCEKAMARTLPDVRRMYDTSQRTGRILQIGHQRMFNPVYLESMERIRRGDAGAITMLHGCWMRNTEWLFYDVPGGRGTPLDRQRNWRLYEESSAGLLTELGSHHFQVANWVLDAEPEWVMGSGSLNFYTDGREVDDNISLIFRYPGGVHFTYECLNSNAHNGMNFQVFGHKATYELEANKTYLETPPEPPALRRLIHSIETGLFETIPIGGATWIPDQPVEYGGDYISEDYQLNDTQLSLEAFAGFVRRGQAPSELTTQGYLSSVWTLLAEQAIKTRQAVALPPEYRI